MDTAVTLTLNAGDFELRCTAVRGTEAVGHAARLELEFSGERFLDIRALLGTWGSLNFATDHATRSVVGLLTRVSHVASTAREGDESRRYRYRALLESGTARLRLTRRSRTFQNLSLPDIARQVLLSAGWDGALVQLDLNEAHPIQRYVVQYDETDEAFFRRICERAGVYFYFLPTEGEELREVCILTDTSTTLEPVDAPLQVIEDSGEAHAGNYARKLRFESTLLPGRVTLRDYDPERPGLDLRATNLTTSELPRGAEERELEHYQTRIPFSDLVVGEAEARRLLESLQAGAEMLSLETNAVGLYAGACCEVLPCEEDGVVSAEGRYVILRVEHDWESGHAYDVRLHCQPLSQPLRLPRETPEPRLAGVHSAWVTVPEGEEIHVDALGRANARFRWDLEGATDHESSLPIRVMQQNMVDSMALPRGGWEALVAFDQGNPERPLILGKLFNTAQPPTLSLPENKTSSAIRSFASPGSAKMNSIHTNDKAGAQTFIINAGDGKFTTVGGNLKTNTGAVEDRTIGAHQATSVGGTENLSVGQKYRVSSGSQTGTVGGAQNIGVTGKLSHEVASETVLIGGALLEQIGSPAAIATSLGSTALGAMAGSNFLSARLGKVGAMAAQFVAPMATAAYEGYKSGGVSGALKGAATAGVNTGAGMIAGMVPGGDAALSAGMEFAGNKLLEKGMDWSEKQIKGEGSGGSNKKAEGPSAEGGGAGAAQSDASGAEGGGSGNKEIKIAGAAVECVGAANIVTTPASVEWETYGVAQLLVGGAHLTKARSNVSLEVGGASIEASASHVVKAGATVAREVKAALNSTSAALTMQSSAGVGFKAPAIVFKSAGALSCSGGKVSFVVGGTTVSFDGGAVLVEGGAVTFAKKTKQSGSTDH
ncbi:MAG: type VI secretion system tip protein VgrG [Myxococcales bacterium]|nr:type VI secretion system tip protein VgrG [Myxococcales bacterium]MCB9608950.1 type VI secretion system tip protein VgrG [Polyangiaceae bacterium]